MKRFLKSAFIAAIALGSSLVAFAQQQQLPPIPVDQGVRIGKLENGLTYYIRRNEFPAKQADFYIAQKVGAIQEEDHQRGLAHFLEHMCFNGTTNFPGNALRDYLETIGVKFGYNLNAYTAVDETVYNISNVPMLREGIIDSCLLILHDWANDLTLDPKEIDKERGVIHEEWRTGSGAMMRMYEQILPKIYPNSKYGHRLPIGTMEVVDNFPYQALRDYYHKWYRPDLQGIIVVGDIDVDQIEAKIKKLFSGIKMPENPAERIYEEVPDTDKPIVAIAKDKEQPTSTLYLMFKHDAVKREEKGNLGYLVANYMNSIVSTMINNRLDELRQTATPPFIYAGASDGDYLLSKTKGAFTGVAVAKDGGVPVALENLYREILRAKKHGFTASEYARAKADYLRHLESSYNERNKTKTNEYVHEYVRHFLDNEPIPGIENEYAIMNQIAPNIPVEAINMLLPELIKDNQMVMVALCPDKEGSEVPTEESLLAITNKVNAEEIAPYVDQVSDEPLISKEPTAGKIVKKEAGPFGTTVWTLSNGAKVVLKKTDYKDDEIRMSGFSRGGSSLFEDKDALSISQIQVATIGGLGNFSEINLDKATAGKKAYAGASVTGLQQTVTGSCSPKDFETMLQLNYLRFTAPRVDQEAFTSYINRTKASLENQALNPMKALQDTITVALYNNHPRIVRLTSELMDKVDYNRIVEMYKERFADASGFTFYLVGNVDEATAAPLVEKYIASLPSLKRNENFVDRKVNIRSGHYTNHFTKEMETAKSTVLLVYSGKMPYTHKNVLTMSILDQLLDILYTQTIREEAGGTYGVSCGGSLSKYPNPEATMEIYFDTNPERLSEMIGLAKDGIQQFIKEGPKAEDLQKVKEYMLKQHTQDQKENSYWVRTLNNYYWLGVDTETDYAATVNAITAEDLKAFAKEFFGQNNLVEVSMSAPVKK